MDKINDYEELIKRVNKIKASGELDLSMEEDLSIAIMNLISLEEHFFFTAQKTGKDEYLGLLAMVREKRKKFLGLMIKQSEGETWCIAKHLLAASMRFIEVGTKMQSQGKADLAKDTFQTAYELFSLFFALRLKLVQITDFKKDNTKNVEQPWTKERIMTELLDCCKE